MRCSQTSLQLKSASASARLAACGQLVPSPVPVGVTRQARGAADALAVTVKVVLVSLTTVSSAPPLAALAAVPVVWPLRSVSVAAACWPSVAGASIRTLIWSPLLTMASRTQLPVPLMRMSPLPPMRAPPQAAPVPDWLASGAGSVNSHGVPAGRVSAKGPAGRLANGWPPRTTRASVAKLESQLPPVERLKYVTQALFTWPGLGEADQCQPWMPPWP